MCARSRRRASRLRARRVVAARVGLRLARDRRRRRRGPGGRCRARPLAPRRGHPQHPGAVRPHSHFWPEPAYNAQPSAPTSTADRADALRAVEQHRACRARRAPLGAHRARDPADVRAGHELASRGPTASGRSSRTARTRSAVPVRSAGQRARAGRGARRAGEDLVARARAPARRSCGPMPSRRRTWSARRRRASRAERAAYAARSAVAQRRSARSIVLARDPSAATRVEPRGPPRRRRRAGARRSRRSGTRARRRPGRRHAARRRPWARGY